MNIVKLGKVGSSGVTSKTLSCLSQFSYTRRINQYGRVNSSQIRLANIPRTNPGSERKKTVRNYAVAAAIMTLGLTFAAVPLYGVFCRVTGYGGTTQHVIDEDKLKNLQKYPNRKISVKFNSDVSSGMAWKFKPKQSEIQVHPGETALAFYTAINPTERPITGVSTYNVVPFEAGPYFNKIQCFCFEEQLLNPHEEVDMPVFFYIDPEYCEDPYLENVDEIVLSYTFFESKEGFTVPIPGFLKNK